MSVNRAVHFTGITFQNPFLLSSAPPTESESNILRAFEAGWAGVVTKTIGLHPVANVLGAKAKFMRTSPEDSYVSMKKRPGAALHSSWNWELLRDWRDLRFSAGAVLHSPRLRHGAGVHRSHARSGSRAQRHQAAAGGV
jgi:hypothetical protein